MALHRGAMGLSAWVCLQFVSVTFPDHTRLRFCVAFDKGLTAEYIDCVFICSFKDSDFLIMKE